MKITKYEHACLDIRLGDQRMVVDPGAFTTSLDDYSNIDVVIITHVHGDHFDKEKLEKIVELNPLVKIFSTNEVAEQAPELAINTVSDGDIVDVEEFKINFYGKDHAEIDPKTPLVENFGILVNNILYYPGDSFTPCPEKFKILAVPASGPWLRVGQTIPLIEESDCETVFPTHNALLSDIGHATTNNWLEKFAQRSGKKFIYLKNKESLEV